MHALNALSGYIANEDATWNYENTIEGESNPGKYAGFPDSCANTT